VSLSATNFPAQRVALFGGAFDPFHNGHVAAIRHLLKSPHIDTVLVVPSGDRPDKRGASLASDRYEMTRRGVAAVFGGDPRVEVSDLQVRGEVGYGTIDLVLHFERDPSKKAFVVIGQELLGDLEQWKDAAILKQKAHFLVIQRPGSPRPHLPQGWNVVVLEPFSDGGIAVSSTELRDKIRSGTSVEGLLPKEVLTYCHEKRLYV